MTLSIANDDASLPVAYRLYLPKDWASDSDSRAAASRNSGRGARLDSESLRCRPARVRRPLHYTKLAVDRLLMWIRGRSGESPTKEAACHPFR